jgi:hypothetical protein
VITMRRLLPAFVSTPRRAAVSTVLIAGIAAGLAGHADANTGKPTANPIVAAITFTHPKAPTVQWGPVVPPAAGANATGNAVGAAQAAPGQAPAAQAPAQAPAAQAPAPAPVVPTSPAQGDLLPNGEPGGQSAIDLGGDQVDNAKAIIHATKEMNLPPRAAVIAVATSLQESKLHNLGDLGAMNDHDSLGLFQQRPSSGWGSPEQVTNPDYATKAFLSGLTRVPGWQRMPLTDAAQSVQVSAFGDAYAQWEKQAADIVANNFNA